MKSLGAPVRDRWPDATYTPANCRRECSGGFYHVPDLQSGSRPARPPGTGTSLLLVRVPAGRRISPPTLGPAGTVGADLGPQR